MAAASATWLSACSTTPPVAFLPFLGSAITVLLGLMRSNLLLSVVSIAAGKVARYVLLVYGADLLS